MASGPRSSRTAPITVANTQPPAAAPSLLVRRLGLAKGIVVAPDLIDAANSVIADLFEQG